MYQEYQIDYNEEEVPLRGRPYYVTNIDELEEYQRRIGTYEERKPRGG